MQSFRECFAVMLANSFAVKNFATYGKGITADIIWAIPFLSDEALRHLI